MRSLQCNGDFHSQVHLKILKRVNSQKMTCTGSGYCSIVVFCYWLSFLDWFLSVILMCLWRLVPMQCSDIEATCNMFCHCNKARDGSCGFTMPQKCVISWMVPKYLPTLRYLPQRLISLRRRERPQTASTVSSLQRQCLTLAQAKLPPLSGVQLCWVLRHQWYYQCKWDQHRVFAETFTYWLIHY